VDTVQAFLHYPFGTYGDVWILVKLGACWPFGLVPVEVAGTIGASHSTVAAANASFIPLEDEA
jgi:hypothetical protein